MERSIAAAGPLDALEGARARRVARGRGRAILVGLGLAAACLAIYIVSHPDRPNFYDHFVWQASAWIDGRTSIPYPVEATATSPGNAYFQDVMPITDASGASTGRGLIPFPPLPALVLLPFVAVWGLATNAQLIAAVLGSLDVAIAWWVLGRLPLRPATRLLGTIFLALGTVLWYAAAVGTTWFLAHVVAVGLTLLSIGVALAADPDAGVEAMALLAQGEPAVQVRSAPSGESRAWLGALASRVGEALRRAFVEPGSSLLDRRGFLAGFLLGLAATSRLTAIFGAPFLILVGGGENVARRAASALAGMAVPVIALVAYDLASTGHAFSPVYEYLYRLEASGYPWLGYHPDWAIEDIRYLPGNLGLMLVGLPQVMPACDPGAVARGLFDAACPIARPDPVGMGLLLTSPAYLLGLPAVAARAGLRSRLVVGAAVAVLLIAVVNLMHFSQGWVQFGYRFSLDFAPFALILVVLGVERRGGPGRLAWLLLAVSVVVTAWGVIWGDVLGW